MEADSIRHSVQAHRWDAEHYRLERTQQTRHRNALTPDTVVNLSALTGETPTTG